MILIYRLFGLLFLFFLVLPASESSLLSQQYLANWTSGGFFPLEISRVYVGSVQNETGHGASFDIERYLENQICERISPCSAKAHSPDDKGVHVDINIYLYQEGSVFGRWLGGGAGVAYVVAHAMFRKGGQPVGAELLSVSVIQGGGLFSAGAEKTVLVDVAAAIASFLKEGGGE